MNEFLNPENLWMLPVLLIIFVVSVFSIIPNIFKRAVHAFYFHKYGAYFTHKMAYTRLLIQYREEKKNARP